MFTKLGRKIIRDAQNPSYVVKEDDDNFNRYIASKCEGGDDVYYHGGHSHDHDDGLTEDQKYEKAMY